VLDLLFSSQLSDNIAMEKRTNAQLPLTEMGKRPKPSICNELRPAEDTRSLPPVLRGLSPEHLDKVLKTRLLKSWTRY